MDFKTARDIWDAALGELQVQVSKANYKTWLEKTTGLRCENDQFVVGVPNTFIAEYLDKNQRSLIEKTIIGILHRNIQVVFHVESGGQPQFTCFNNMTESPVLNTNFTFDSFVVGNNNRLAYSAAREITKQPGICYNPLLICGGSGLGKTHLLQAIGHQAITNKLRVLYTSSEQYTNEFIRALRERNTEEFRNKYRSTDMLLIDDINFVTGKDQTEESLFHTINELQNANRQIVVTADCPPQYIPGMGERLRSRLQGGLIADIQIPDIETRKQILTAKAKQKGIEINPETIEVIAERIRHNIRELEGSLNRVIAYARLIRDSITPELATHALENVGENKEEIAPVNPKLLVGVVADSFRITPETLLGRKRDKETATARHMAMYVMKQQFSYSLSKIGQEVGGRNPATVTHGYQKISHDLSSSSYLQERLKDIQERLHNIDH